MDRAIPPCEVRIQEKSTDPRREDRNQWFRFMPDTWNRPVDERHELPYITEGSLVGRNIIEKGRGHVFEIDLPQGHRRLRLNEVRPYTKPKRDRK